MPSWPSSVRDLGEQERDLGHRLLPPGEHLGVADRSGQRQHDRGELHRGDPVDRRGTGANGLAAAVVVVVLIGTSFVGWDFSGVSVRR